MFKFSFINENVKNELVMLLRCYVSKSPKLEGIRPKSILLYGVRGVGKTSLIKEVIADENIPHILLEPAMIPKEMNFEKFLKESVEHISEKDRCVVILDNLDPLLSSAAIRWWDSHDAGNGHLLIAVADVPPDHPRSGPESSLFEYVIEVPPLGKEQADMKTLEFWKNKADNGEIKLKNADVSVITDIMDGLPPEASETVFRKVCLYEVGDVLYPIGDYERIVLIAAVDALCGVPYKLSEAPDDIRSENCEGVVYEAGKVVVSELLKPGSVRLSTIHHLPGDPAGKTLRYPLKTAERTPEEERNEVKFLLAGKAAVEAVYGKGTSRCRKDLSEAASIVSDLVTWDCSLDFTIFPVSDPSETMKAAVEKAAASELKQLYDETCSIVREHRIFLDAVFNHLVKAYTITQKELSRIYMMYER